MCTGVDNFRAGDGLWIVPCRGIHTFAMNFPIDALYLDANSVVVHMEEGLRPWRLGCVSLKASSVLELPRETVRASGTVIGDEIDIGTGVPREG